MIFDFLVNVNGVFQMGFLKNKNFKAKPSPTLPQPVSNPLPNPSPTPPQPLPNAPFHPPPPEAKLQKRCLKISSKQKGPGEEGAAGYCPKILPLKSCKNGALSLP